MKKLLAIVMSVAMMLTLCTVFASAAVTYTPGAWGTTAEDFKAVGDVAMYWDTKAADKITLDGDMSDWTANNYEMTTITPDNLVSWVGSVPSTWEMRCAFVADSEKLYVGFYIVDDKACTGDNYAGYNGDAFQIAFDWNSNVANALEEDDSAVGNPQDIFYSFCLTEDGTLQMMRQNSDGADGLVYDGNEVEMDDGDKENYGDLWQGIAGASKTTSDGWCAEFSIEWQRLANDCRWKLYDEDGSGIYKPAEMSPEKALTIGCSLYYLNRDENNGGVTWAAGTTKGNLVPDSETPGVSWTAYDDGVRLVLNYEEGMSFVDGAGIVLTGVAGGDEETEPATEEATEPATEPATEEATEPATEEATEAATETATEAATETATEAATSASTTAATSASTTASEDEGCSSVIGAGAAALVLSAMAAAVALKKKH